MPNIPKMIDATHAIKVHVDKALLRARVHDNGESRIAATLCLTIAEQFSAVVSLVESGFSSHAPIIVRSMLEGLANLLILIHDSTYVDQLRFENARNDVILFDEYAADPEMQHKIEAQATLAEWK